VGGGEDEVEGWRWGWGYGYGCGCGFGCLCVRSPFCSPLRTFTHTPLLLRIPAPAPGSSTRSLCVLPNSDGAAHVARARRVTGQNRPKEAKPPIRRPQRRDRRDLHDDTGRFLLRRNRHAVQDLAQAGPAPRRVFYRIRRREPHARGHGCQEGGADGREVVVLQLGR